jgi:hypothetical protein
VSEDSFRKLLDQSLAFDEARDILRYKKRCGEFSCEVELLDCVSAMINKRHQLLPEVGAGLRSCELCVECCAGECTSAAWLAVCLPVPCSGPLALA